MDSSSADSASPAARRVAWGVAAALVLSVPAFIGGYHLHLLIMAGIFSILAVSLGLVIGYAGLLSLGHTAFFGLGAYASGLLFLKLGMSMWWGMLVAATLSSLVAFLLGALILRVRGNRFVIVTEAFAEIMRLVAHNWVDLTRGHHQAQRRETRRRRNQRQGRRARPSARAPVRGRRLQSRAVGRQRNRKFIDDYRAKFKEVPTKFSVGGYQTVHLLAQAIQKAGSTEGDKIRDALKTTNYDGLTGNYRFDDKGQAYNFNMYIVANGPKGQNVVREVVKIAKQ